MLSSIIKYSKMFIFTFIITFLTLISSNHIVNALTPRISEDQIHATHYVISSSVKYGKKSFKLQYTKKGSTNWTTSIKNGMKQWNAEGTSISLGDSTYKIESKAYGTASWAGDTTKYTIFLNDSAVKNDTQRSEVVAHELGHTLGLGHVSCQSELMRSTGLKGSASLYAGDIAGYHKIW